MNSSSLPLELIQLVLSFLPKTHLIHLLIDPPNHSWLYATASVIYRKFVFTRYTQLSACHNLFEQTRERRQQQLVSRKNTQHGFYSSINYSAFVRQLDLSLLCEKEKLNDSLLIGLTIDCQHLCNLNLYNCYTLNTTSMINVLLHCPQLEILSLAGATGMNVSCFLDSRVLLSTCQQLRVLNLNLLPLFFDIPTNIITKYKRQFRKKYDNRVPIFPKLQELKLGMVYHQQDSDSYPFIFMIQRCANIDTLRMDSLLPHHIKICLHYFQQIRNITFRQCHFYQGMFTTLLLQYNNRQQQQQQKQQQQQQQQQHNLERLVIDHCFSATNDNNETTMDSVCNELMTADFHRLEWLGCNKMTLPLDLLGLMVTHVSGFYLTRFDCPDSMTDEALETLMTRCPSLTHFSICMFWTLTNTSGYHYDRQQDKRTILTIPILIKALTTWKMTLEWLEITEGRNGRDVYQHGAGDVDDYHHHHQALLSKKIQLSLKEQRTFINYLCDWKTDNKIQVLLLGGMALPLSMDILERLAYCFTNTRYLAFIAKETEHTGMDLEHTMSTWKRLDGVFCINQSTLMARRNFLWLGWKWMDSRKEQFRRWKSHDVVS